MSTIKINQQLKRVEFKEFEISNEIVYAFFDKLSTTERDEKLLKAIYIGVLALMEDRISSFLAKTTNELGTEMESLKMLFDMKSELFYKSAIKGVLAESDIAEYLMQYLGEKKIKDKIILTGNSAGVIPKNKTGDILCEIDGNSDKSIVIECKFDKSIKLGNIADKDVFTRKTDSVWSQLIESKANRDAKVGIIVLDISLTDNSILKEFDNVGYIPGVGLVAIINSQKGNYSNLTIAYMLARDIAKNAKEVEFDKDLLAIIIKRTIKDINEVLAIKSLVQSNINNNNAILKQLEKSLLLTEFNQEFLHKFLNTGTLTKRELLDFYNAEDVKDKYRQVEKDIEQY